MLLGCGDKQITSHWRHSLHERLPAGNPVMQSRPASLSDSGPRLAWSSMHQLVAAGWWVTHLALWGKSKSTPWKKITCCFEKKIIIIKTQLCLQLLFVFLQKVLFQALSVSPHDCPPLRLSQEHRGGVWHGMAGNLPGENVLQGTGGRNGAYWGEETGFLSLSQASASSRYKGGTLPYTSSVLSWQIVGLDHWANPERPGCGDTKQTNLRWGRHRAGGPAEWHA